MPRLPDLQDRNGHSLSQKSTDLNQLEAPDVDVRDWSISTKELIDTLPQVWTRGLLYFLVLFVTIGLPWAMFSQIDEVGSAKGRLEPQGKTTKLDAPVSGTVVAIQVKEGEQVQAGQTLLSLESEPIVAALGQAQAKLQGETNRLTQLQASAIQINAAKNTQRQENQSQIQAQEAETDQIKKRLDSRHKFQILAKTRLLIDAKEVERYRQFVKQGIVPEVSLVTALRTMNESQRNWEQIESDLEQDRLELTKQQSVSEKMKHSGELVLLQTQKQLQDTQSQIGSLRSDIAQTLNQIKSLQFQLQQHIIRSPISGTIFQLPIQRPGAVVQAGQPVAQIADRGNNLVLRAQITPQESGFIKSGMPVKVKFDAYPFQDYGVVPGRLTWVSPDSRTIETSQGKAETFELEIELEQTYIQAQGKRILLAPGQTATAEIITRQSRLIDFIIKPFKQLQIGGLKL